MSDDQSALSDFSGMARLFPLPNMVLFPYVMLPLHIFEPRYRQLTEDALAGDRLITMALLRPGWEEDYEKSPGIYPVVCVGRIVAEQRLEDGRFNLLLRGLSRARVLHEVDDGKPYRNARLQLLTDHNQPTAKVEQNLRRRLTRRVPHWFPAPAPGLEQFQKLLQADLPLGALCDIISFALPLDLEVKQRLLEQLDIKERARWLVHYLEKNQPPPAEPARKREFPPEFSTN